VNLDVPEITIVTHRPSFVDINLEVSRSRTNSRVSNINIIRRMTNVTQQFGNESTKMANGEENASNELSKSVTINADDDTTDHVMFESGELNVHLDKITWANAPWKLSALV